MNSRKNLAFVACLLLITVCAAQEIPTTNHSRSISWILAEKRNGAQSHPPALPPAKDGREHLDIYIRERLRPEFEDPPDRLRQRSPRVPASGWRC